MRVAHQPAFRPARNDPADERQAGLPPIGGAARMPRAGARRVRPRGRSTVLETGGSRVAAMRECSRDAEGRARRIAPRDPVGARRSPRHRYQAGTSRFRWEGRIATGGLASTTDTAGERARIRGLPERCPRAARAPKRRRAIPFAPSRRSPAGTLATGRLAARRAPCITPPAPAARLRGPPGPYPNPRTRPWRESDANRGQHETDVDQRHPARGAAGGDGGRTAPP